jgi:hypothetical protein
MWMWKGCDHQFDWYDGWALPPSCEGMWKWRLKWNKIHSGGYTLKCFCYNREGWC